MKRDLLERDIAVEVDWNQQSPVGRAKITEEDGEVTIAIRLSGRDAMRVVDFLETEQAVGMSFCYMHRPVNRTEKEKP